MKKKKGLLGNETSMWLATLLTLAIACAAMSTLISKNSELRLENQALAETNEILDD
jgi:hypothetical protein